MQRTNKTERSKIEQVRVGRDYVKVSAPEWYYGVVVLLLAINALISFCELIK